MAGQRLEGCDGGGLKMNTPASSLVGALGVNPLERTAVERMPARPADETKLALYVREKIICDAALTDRLARLVDAEELGAGDVLVLAAQRLVGPAAGERWTYVNDGDPVDAPTRVVVVADEYTGAGELVFGGRDGPGRDARHVEFFVGDADGLHISANGGSGKDGQHGRAGQDLVQLQEFDPESRRTLYSFQEPKAGTDGQPGVPGGDGGEVRVTWVSGSTLTSAAEGRGGRGGTGGAGGKGGTGFYGSGNNVRSRTFPDTMPAGKNGLDGRNGTAGAVGGERVGREQLWARVRAVLGLSGDAVADHWYQVGEHRFRRIAGAPSETELLAVLKILDASILASGGAHASAIDLRDHLLGGRNALGLPRHADLVPDVEYWDARLTEGLHASQGLYSELLGFLQDLTTQHLRDADLQAQAAHAEAALSILNGELKLSEADVQAAESDVKYAGEQWSQIKAEVTRRKTALENAQADWGGLITLGFASIVGIAINVATAGAADPWVKTVLQVIPDVLAISDANFEGSEAETKLLVKAVTLSSDVLAGSKGLKDLAERKDANGEVDIGRLVRESGTLLISFAKLIKDLDEAGGDPALKALVKELARAGHQKSLAERARDRAVAIRELALVRVTRATEDFDRYRALVERSEHETGQLRDTALQLLTAAQACVDSALCYQFRMARAVEIYALADTSAQMRLAYGRVHPDDRADFRQGFVSASDFRDILLASNMSALHDVAALKRVFRTVLQGHWDSAMHYVVIDDPAALEQFRSTRSLSIAIGVDELDPDHYGARAAGTILTLSGASSKTPSFESEITHYGVCRQRWWTPNEKAGVVAEQQLEPSRQNVHVVPPHPEAPFVTGSLSAPRDRALARGFWGRGIAATWRISIKPYEYVTNGVDLTGLTRITFGIEYEWLREMPS
jgi:hypothetical protein